MGQPKPQENRQRRRNPPDLRSTNRPLLTGRAIAHPIIMRIEVLCEGIADKTKGFAKAIESNRSDSADGIVKGMVRRSLPLSVLIVPFAHNASKP